MMNADLAQLFEKDETAWLDNMAQLLNERRFNMLDYSHLEEFLLDMAKRDRREIKSRLVILLAHMLKWDYQPRRRSKSWQRTLHTQRWELREALESKTLYRYAQEVLDKAYAVAVERAAMETGWKLKKFPAECPYSLEQLLKPTT